MSVNHLFLLASSSKLSHYTDDNNLYTLDYYLEEVKQVLLNGLNRVIDWFFDNYIVLNAEKCHFMCLILRAKIQKMKLSS